MVTEWREVEIGSLGRVVTGRTPAAANQHHWGGQVPFLTPSDIDHRRSVCVPQRFLSSAGVQALNRALVPYGVGVSCIGSQMGKAILIDTPTVTNQQINTVVPDPQRVSRLFLYYALSIRREEFFRLGAGGSTIPILNKSTFAGLYVKLPPLPEQRSIASILGALDDKIDLNRRMNETLEAMARAIFKSWFVDFDPVRAKAEGKQPFGIDADTAALFPDRLVDSEIGPIPEGWEVSAVANCIDITGGGTPRRSETSYWDGKIPWFSVVDAPSNGMWVLDTRDHITDLGLAGSSAKMLRVGTTIISARGTVGKCAFVGTPMSMNQSCYGITPKNGAVDCYTYLLIRSCVDVLARMAHGAVFDTITKSTFEQLQRVQVPEIITVAFEGTVRKLFDKSKSCCSESRTLAELRDLLLPKLLSGEIRVKEAEKIVEDAV